MAKTRTFYNIASWAPFVLAVIAIIVGSLNPHHAEYLGLSRRFPYGAVKVYGFALLVLDTVRYFGLLVASLGGQKRMMFYVRLFSFRHMTHWAAAVSYVQLIWISEVAEKSVGNFLVLAYLVGSPVMMLAAAIYHFRMTTKPMDVREFLTSGAVSGGFCLLLRCFRTDGQRHYLNVPSFTPVSIEELIATQVRSYLKLPTVAIVEPGEESAVPGIHYLIAPADWKESVRELMQSAGFVVVVFGRGDQVTESLQWELEQLRNCSRDGKLLLVFEGNQDFRTPSAADTVKAAARALDLPPGAYENAFLILTRQADLPLPLTAASYHWFAPMVAARPIVALMMAMEAVLRPEVRTASVIPSAKQ